MGKGYSFIIYGKQGFKEFYEGIEYDGLEVDIWVRAIPLIIYVGQGFDLS